MVPPLAVTEILPRGSTPAALVAGVMTTVALGFGLGVGAGFTVRFGLGFSVGFGAAGELDPAAFGAVLTTDFGAAAVVAPVDPEPVTAAGPSSGGSTTMPPLSDVLPGALPEPLASTGTPSPEAAAGCVAVIVTAALPSPELEHPERANAATRPATTPASRTRRGRRLRGSIILPVCTSVVAIVCTCRAEPGVSSQLRNLPALRCRPIRYSDR